MKKMKVILIIPAYNEEENILKTVKDIEKYNKRYHSSYDVIVINDGSVDKTSEICHKNKIPVIDLIHNLGIGGAVQTGYKYAYKNNYDVAVQFDGDGQHNVSYVKKIIEPIINNESDMVIGSRFIEKIDTFQSTKARRLGINIISKLIKLVTRKKILDTTSGFRAVNKDIIKEFQNSYPVEYPEPLTTTVLLKKNYRVKEVSVEMNEREGGVSSIRKWKTVYYMVNVILSIMIIGLRRYKKCR